MAIKILVPETFKKRVKSTAKEIEKNYSKSEIKKLWGIGDLENSIWEYLNQQCFYYRVYNTKKIFNILNKILLNKIPTENYFLTVKNKLDNTVEDKFEKYNIDKNEAPNYIKKYFKVIENIYDDNNNFKDEIEFIPENRETFIKSNLKLVVSTAKRYIGMGVDFEDLIQAGNYGLCLAFEKYDNERNGIRKSVLEELSSFDKEKKWSKKQVEKLINKYYKYKKANFKLFDNLPDDGFKDTLQFEKWVKKNIKPAIFASVAFQWIRAYILIEINKYAHVVQIPKETITNMPAKTQIIAIEDYASSLYSENSTFDIPSDDYEEMNERLDEKLKQQHFKELIHNLTKELSPRDRRIIYKRFGIGMPGCFTVQEIALDEDLSVGRVISIIQNIMETMKKGISNENKEDIVNLLSF